MSIGDRVIGLDLSLTATGICAADGTTSVVRPRKELGDGRLQQIRDHVRFVAQGAYLAVIEDLPKHAMAAGITGMVHGAVRVALLDLGVPYVLVVPATLKKYATGKGNADKTAMAIAALKRAGREFTDDNECDAFWLHLMGLDALGHSPLQLPADQVDQLKRVAWPEAMYLASGA